MNEEFLLLCAEWDIDPIEFVLKIEAGIQGVDIRHFTDEELQVIKTCVMIASE